jgi:hypothetical protein
VSADCFWYGANGVNSGGVGDGDVNFVKHGFGMGNGDFDFVGGVMDCCFVETDLFGAWLPFLLRFVIDVVYLRFVLLL